MNVYFESTSIGTRLAPMETIRQDQTIGHLNQRSLAEKNCIKERTWVVQQCLQMENERKSASS